MVNAPAWAGILGLICLICSKAAAPGPELGARLRGVTDAHRSRRPIFIATLWAGASWLFFRVARSTRMTQIWVLRSRLEKQPTDLRAYTCYFGDRALDDFLTVVLAAATRRLQASRQRNGRAARLWPVWSI